MKENFDKCFELVLGHEGKYVNDPRDPGGRTNMGVTQRNWETYVGKPVDENIMRNLTPDEVKPFYKKMYWNKIKGDDLPAGIDYATFDFAVNSGVNKAAKCLQEIVGVQPDGIIGMKSLEAIKAAPPDEVVDALCDMRMQFLKSLSKFNIYGKGWSSRVAQVKSVSDSMA